MEGQEPARTDQHLWRHSLESSVLAVVSTLLAAITVPHSVPSWMLSAGLLVAGAVTAFSAAVTTGSGFVGAYFLAWGIMLSAWLAAARAAGPWHAQVIFSLVLPAVILAPLGALAVSHSRRRRDEDALAAEKARNDRELRKWSRLLERCGVPGTEILDVVRHGNGLAVHGRLGKAADGQVPATLAQLQGIAEKVAVSERKSRDAVHFEEGGNAAEFVMHIRDRKGPREIAYLPAENHPLTITRPLGLALRDDGREYRLLLREINVLIAGVTGAGKSNLVNVIIAQLARCVDVVIWMIDLKGGRAARPWMLPWIQGFTKRPVIDWLATTREEAALMLDALWAAREDRSRSGAGGEKITPSADQPAIILIGDEAAVLFGHGNKDGGVSSFKAARRMVQIAETGRSEAVNAVLAAVRADVETLGSTGFKAMSRVRIGLAVTSESDGRSVFPDDAHAAAVLSRITDPGDGLVKAGRTVSPVLHFYRVTDGYPDDEGNQTKDRITPVALWAGNEIRPQLEDRLVLAMGEAYGQRWTRPHGQALKREWGAGAGLPPPVDPDTVFGQIVIANKLDDLEKPADPRQVRMREILRQRGWQGYTPARLVARLADEGLTTPRETVQRWLKADRELGLVRDSGRPHHRWAWVYTEEDMPGTG